MAARKILFKGKGETVMEGAGVPVTRVLPSRFLDFHWLDPILLLDEFKLYEQVEEAFPEHPHRGFEIITYMLKGSSTHEDNLGNSGVIGEGDAQKITTGAGIWHGEGPGSKDEPMHGIQLWINLARKDKQIDPDYKIAKDKDLPREKINGVEIKHILGGGSPLELVTPSIYQDIVFEKGKEYTAKVPDNFNSVVYVLSGSVNIDGQETSEGEFVVFGQGDFIEFENASSETRLILVGAGPIREPVSWQGPFVD